LKKSASIFEKRRAFFTKLTDTAEKARRNNNKTRLHHEKARSSPCVVASGRRVSSLFLLLCSYFKMIFLPFTM